LNPTAWNVAAPAPLSFTVRSGVGVGGSDRVTIIWADRAIKNQWLKTTVTLPGLAAPDVFYFGNAVGESGNLAGSTDVDANDEIRARTDPHSFDRPAPLALAYDFDRDGMVNATDQIIARSNTTDPLHRLALIALPAELALSSASAAPGVVLPDLATVAVGLVLAQTASAASDAIALPMAFEPLRGTAITSVETSSLRAIDAVHTLAGDFPASGPGKRSGASGPNADERFDEILPLW
jgi:hypothetical protein